MNSNCHHAPVNFQYIQYIWAIDNDLSPPHWKWCVRNGSPSQDTLVIQGRKLFEIRQITSPVQKTALVQLTSSFWWWWGEWHDHHAPESSAAVSLPAIFLNLRWNSGWGYAEDVSICMHVMKVETGHRRKLEQLKNPGCLAYREDSTTQLYGDYIYIYSLQQASIRIPINLPVLWNVASFFFLLTAHLYWKAHFQRGWS